MCRILGLNSILNNWQRSLARSKCFHQACKLSDSFNSRSRLRKPLGNCLRETSRCTGDFRQRERTGKYTYVHNRPQRSAYHGSDAPIGPLTALTRSPTAACFHRAGVGTQTGLPPCCDSIRAAPVSLQPSTAPLALYPHNAPGEHTPDCPGRASPSGGRVRVTPPGMMEGQDSLKRCQWGQSMYIYINKYIYIYIPTPVCQRVGFV